MERNANDTVGTQDSGIIGTTGAASSSGLGAGATTSGTSQPDGGIGSDGNSGAGGLADRARSAAGAAGEKIASVGSVVRDKAGTLKNSVADALESGAERLRQQGAGGGQTAGAAATGNSAAMVADDSRLGQTSNQIAGGLQASADWLRDADVDGLKSGIERQVKEHPGRTLAIAVGVGYLLGKAFRK